MTGSTAATLPIGWRLARIGDVFDSWGGHTPSKAEPTYWGDGIPWVSSKDVKSPRLATSTHSVTQRALEQTGLRVCPPGSVLVVMRSGILAHTLPVSVTEVPVTINQDLKAFHSDEPLLNEWLALFLRMSAQQLLASSRRDGTTVQSVQYPLLKNTMIPVPPVDQRACVIDVVKALLAKRESAYDRLLEARQSLEMFDGSVLAAACTGRLTGDWRDQNFGVRPALPDSAGTKRPRRPRSQQVELELPLPDLPDTYIVRPLGEVATLIQYGTSKRCDASVDNGVPVLRMSNIQDGRIDTGELKYCLPDDRLGRLMLEDGDLLFNRTNSPELVGKSAVFHEPTPMSFASYVIRVRFGADVVPDYVSYWINSAWGRTWARLTKTDGVSQSNISASKLALLPLPLPPIDEQREIVSRSRRLLGIGARLLERTDLVCEVVGHIQQAILAKTFRGELGR